MVARRPRWRVGTVATSPASSPAMNSDDVNSCSSWLLYCARTQQGLSATQTRQQARRLVQSWLVGLLCFTSHAKMLEVPATPAQQQEQSCKEQLLMMNTATTYCSRPA